MKEFVEKPIEKIKVTSLEIIVTGTKDKPYFEIKYKVVGKEDYNIGYSSYDLNNVLNWKEECFEIVNQLAEEYGKDTNVTTNADFIRNMNDEELAEFLLKVNTANEQPCMIDGGDCKWEDYPTRDKGCKDCFLEYLRKEVKGS